MDRGTQLMGVDLGLWTLALIVVALRAYTRLWVRRDFFGADDILMFISMACFTVYVALALTGIQHGASHRYDEIPNEKSIEAKKFWWACYHAYAITITFTKLSVSWFILRLTTINRTHRRIVHGAITLTVCNGIMFITFTIVQCQPIHFFWDQRGHGKCVDRRIFLAVGSTCSINIVTDLVYALLPAWIIYHLQMKLKTRIALMILMGMGCLFIYLTNSVAIWSTTELCLAIMAGSLATLRPLVIKVGRKLGIASAMSASANNIEFGPLGPPPVLLRDRTNSIFSRRRQSTHSNAVLLETERAVPFNGAHFSRHVIITRSSHKDPSLERDHDQTDSTMSSWPPKM